MDEREIIIRALKAEATAKPNERIYVGFKSLTYKEFVEMLDNHKKLDKMGKEFVESFLKTAVKMFRENQAYRENMMKLAGVKP